MPSTPQHDPADPDTEQRFHSAPGFFPTANVPVWVTMHPHVDAESLAVAQFIVAYRNSSDGSLPYVGRSTILRRFGHKKDWLDRRVSRLEHIGFLSRIAMYEDAHTGERTPDRHASDGTSNRQTSNDWLLHDQPPAGDFHPHPIQSSEFGNDDRVQERIERRARVLASIHRGGGATQRPGSDQEKPEFSQVAPQALHSAPRGRYTAPRTKTRGTRTTNQPAPEAASDDGGSMDGWLAAAPDGEKTSDKPTPSDGCLLLQRQGVTGRALDEWADLVDEAIAQLGRSETQRDLAGNLGGLNNPAGAIVQYRLPRLRERLSAVSASTVGGDGAQQQTDGWPEWCGRCDKLGRTREDEQGRPAKCPDCHKHASKPSAAAQRQQQESADDRFLDHLSAMSE